MKRQLILAFALSALGGSGLLGLAAAAPAAAQSAPLHATAALTTTFAIQNMTCALCPVTVRKAMEGVRGVMSVKIDFDAKTATVVYDPAVTNADAIADASTNAGYPASFKG
jgi:mercuric ion binding protein